MKQGVSVTTIALSSSFFSEKKMLDQLDSTKTADEHVTLARACLVLSYRLHRENAETMREAT